MKIYLIYEEHYDPCIEYIDSVTVYPYKSMYGVIQRLIDETGKTKEEIEQDLKETNSTATAHFYYRIEESELL